MHGAEGLRVVDASVFPFVTNGNIYAPVMMVASGKASDLIAGNTPLPALDVPWYRPGPGCRSIPLAIRATLAAILSLIRPAPNTPTKWLPPQSGGQGPDLATARSATRLRQTRRTIVECDRGCLTYPGRL